MVVCVVRVAVVVVVHGGKVPHTSGHALDSPSVHTAAVNCSGSTL